MTMIGAYERLNDQPVAARSSMPFICLTDDPNLRSDAWDVRLIEPTFPMDPIRSQRDLKLRPHLHLPEFEASLYIDNTVILKEPPEVLFDRHWTSARFALPSHSYRDSVLDEFLEVARLGLDEPSRIFEQLNHYELECPEVLALRPYWCGILFRGHRDEAVQQMLETWYLQVVRYARRDQLSAHYAFRKAQLQPEVIDIDNRESWLHTNSRENGRATGGVRRPAAYFAPPSARLREVEVELNRTREYHLAAHRRMETAERAVEVLSAERKAEAEARKALEQLISSPKWQRAAKLIALAERHPWLMRVLDRQ